MSRLRRDPRAERAGQRIAGTDRPRFDLAAAAQPAVADVGPGTMRPRKNPRAAWALARTPAAGVRFDIALLGVAAVTAPASPDAGTAAPAAPFPRENLRLRQIPDPAYLVLAVADAPRGRLTARDRQVLGAARVLADHGGGAVVLLAMEQPGDAGAAGADRLVAFQDAVQLPAGPDAFADAVIDVIRGQDPRHVLFAETPGGGDLARRVAVRLGEPLFAAAEQISPRVAVRAARGRTVEQRMAPQRLLSLADGAAAPHIVTLHEARDLPFPWSGPAPSARLSSLHCPADPQSVALGEAEFVIAAGNGVTDFAAFNALARTLRATPGASRIVCDAGLMPRAAQVGASGTVLAAPVYLALGIAGAPQHLQGIAGCEHVVAVNTDLHAAMIERADLAIVADAQAVMTALLAALPPGRSGATATLHEPSRAGCDRAKPTTTRVMTLLSEGRHRGSGRRTLPRREAQAIRLARMLDPDPTGLHAGPDCLGVREALGRGLARLTHLEQIAGTDPVAALAATIAGDNPDLVLAGQRGEGHQDTGLVPYAVANWLGWPIVADAVAITLPGDGTAIIEVALPRGARRLDTVRLPAVVTVDGRAPPPLPFAYGRARAGRVEVRQLTGASSVVDPGRERESAIEERPYRHRPRATGSGASGASAADRLAAATGSGGTGGAGRLLVDPAPEQAAAAILLFLRQKGVGPDQPGASQVGPVTQR